MDKSTTSAAPGPSDTALAQADFLAGFLTEAEYAARRGVSLRTVQRDRQLRQAPPFVVMGRRIYYRVEALREWLIARERRENRQPAAPRAGRSS